MTLNLLVVFANFIFGKTMRKKTICFFCRLILIEVVTYYVVTFYHCKINGFFNGLRALKRERIKARQGLTIFLSTDPVHY